MEWMNVMIGVTRAPMTGLKYEAGVSKYGYWVESGVV